ncbi:hypothetical protein [Tabrizicola sp. M-4]|uniref:hypothetical protein n=1 Tax=Tabrizicola sp. M-4 TaxID=3055847 RepID=UPI003DAA1727
MRVLVFGNSHAACLMEAWREGEIAAGHEVEFFVRSGSGVTGYALTGSRIVAETEALAGFLAKLGLPAEQDLAGFDALAVVASEVSMFPLVQVLNVYRVLEWRQGGQTDRPALTEAVLRMAFAEALMDTSASRLVADLRKVPAFSDRPIHLLPQPFPSERLMTMGRIPAGAGFRRLLREGMAARAAAVYAEELARFAARIGAVLHPQPAETVAQHCLTAEGYSTRARRLFDLGKLQPQGDILHANLAYGRLALAQILR